jgi:hypothetical protein
MKNTIVYDKAKYHYDGNFPKDLPIEQGFVHTGMFLGWILENDLYNQDFFQEIGLTDAVARFKKREITGTKVYEELDGSLTDEDLNEEGNKFAQFYFDFSKGEYQHDYARVFVGDLPSIYDVQDTWENYDKISRVITERYEKWKGKKWWKFF